jgi:hypothetical protein
MKKLTDLAHIIRSKNAGPFELTLDILFRREEDFAAVRDRNLITREEIARRYGIDLDAVSAVIYFTPARAVKIVLARACASGSPGDTDVYGAQQHAPLLDMEIDL